VRRLPSWTRDLDASVSQVVQEPVDEVGSALSTRDPPRWRPTLAHSNENDLYSQGGRSPISLLLPDSPAQESSVCASETHHGRTVESASLSRPSYHDTEHEQAALTAEPALEGQGATESLIESSSKAKSAAIRQTAVKRVSKRLQTAPWSRLSLPKMNDMLLSHVFRTQVKKLMKTRGLMETRRMKKSRQSKWRRKRVQVAHIV
jgi:hypothetical protein